MKDSIEILNYIKEATGLEEKYKSLHAELDAKYQLDQYLLDQKYHKSILSWDIQKNFICKYLKEKSEEKLKIINNLEKEKEKSTDQKSLEKIVKDLEVTKNELKEIRTLKKIFDLKNEDLKKEKERKNDFRSDRFANNGGNIRYNK